MVAGLDHFDEEEDPDPDPHQKEKSDPDPYESQKSDPDPYQSEKRDPDLDPGPHQSDANLLCLWYNFKNLEVGGKRTTFLALLR